jgi:hypothetical protein
MTKEIYELNRKKIYIDNLSISNYDEMFRLILLLKSSSRSISYLANIYTNQIYYYNSFLTRVHANQR